MIWLILLTGLILRLISLNQSLWLDEAINVLATQKFSFWGMVTEYARADFHPPLFFMILWVWTHIFGIGEAVVRIPSMILGVLTIPVVYLIGARLHSKNVGLLSALLLAINPLHIFYSQESRMYVLATLAVSLNCYLFIGLLKGDGGDKWNWGKKGLYVISNFLVLMSDYVAYLIFPAQFVYLLFWQKVFLKVWLFRLGIAALMAIWWLPVFISQLDVGSVVSANLPTWKFVAGGFGVKAIPLTLVKFIIGRISLTDKLVYYSALLPVSFLFLFILFKGIKSFKGGVRKLIVIWIAVPVILATLISFFIPIYSYFRLLFILPAFILLIVFGIFSFQSKLRYIFLGLVLLIQLFSTSVYLFNSSYQREDWRGLVNYLKRNGSKAIIFFESSGTLPPFDYYANDELNAKGALKDFPARDGNDLVDLDSLSRSVKEIFLIDYLVEISDPNRLVGKKLADLEYKLVETKDFRGVGFIYHYVK